MHDKLQPPRHPFIPFRRCLRTFADQNLASHPLKRKFFLAVTLLWRKVFGVDQAEKAIAADFAAGKDGFWHENWIFDSLYYPEISASFILAEDKEKSPSRKAAQLIYGALQFRASLDQMPVEMEAGRPLDMARYRHFFSRLTVSSRNGKRMSHRITDFPASDYVIVAVDGVYYRLPVLVAGKSLPYQDILSQVSGIIDDANAYTSQTQDARSHFGVLTALNNRKSVDLFAKLTTENKLSFDVLNNALFLLAIDVHDHPTTLDRTLRTIHADGYHNRDHRRALQIIVTGNARAGIVVNPHAGLGGSLSARLVSELYKTCQTLIEEVPSVKNAPALYLRVDFSLESLKDARRELAELEAKVQKQLYRKNRRASYQVNGIGKADFLTRKISADAAFHCALHLAYEKCFGVKPVVGNFINLRNVQHGDIWRYISTSKEMHAFVENPSAQKLVAAVDEHKNLVKKHKQAVDPFYQGAMTLMRLINMGELSFGSFISLMLIMTVFVKGFGRNFMGPHLWVSHIPELEGLDMAGRGSSSFSYLDKASLAGHYMIFDNHIRFCLLRSPKDSRDDTKEIRFARCLEESLLQVKNMALLA